MDYEIVELPERSVMGLTARTSTTSPEAGVLIGNLWQRFMNDGMAASVPEAIAQPYTCFGLYFNYDFSDMGYTVLIGCESGASEVPEGMQRQVIPAGSYAKVAIRGGDCVTSVQDVWASVWDDEELTAKRAFTVDFEAYLPSEGMQDADIDIFLALK